MDIGVHILGSVTSNETPGGQKQELRVGTKQDRSGFNGDDYYLQRTLKLARTTAATREEEEDNLSSSSSFAAASYCKTMPFHQGIPLLRSNSPLDSRRQEQMLSFSDKPEALDFTKYVGLDNNCNNKSSLSPFLHHIPPPSYFRNSGGGYGSGGMMMNMMSMQGNFTSVKGPFTLTQWAELEQQALIYKYITANVPVPSSLLISLKKSFYPFGSLPPSSFGWGSFHLGFAGGNMDPEPGRCRRTDGKKWRCSRDAVPDQKYCERHINRGRHRSRKPVEVQSGQTATAATKAVTTTPQQPVVTGNSNNRRASNSNRSLAIGGGQYINPSTESLPNNNRVRNPQIYPSTVNLQPKESPVIHQKHRNNNNNNNPFEFGHISSDSLLNPNANTSKTYGSSFLDFSSNQDKYSGNHNHNSWPEELKSDWTQLSMSIPIASTSPSFSHNNNNNNNNAQDKTTLSPLRLSREIDLSIQTEETTIEPAAKKVNTWIPISWGNSLGGPLGEVLNSTTNSPTLGSSPTGVLQKSTFCSLSNNSSVSSPIAENNNRNNGDYFHYTTT